ncbi:MAG: class I SAM-dependent methyltransferase [Actinobacteria bacterium]|nr:class I SAM-dependent methyltransferase [Actinomycetota bacterium]
MDDRRQRRIADWDRRAGTYDARTSWLERRVLAASREWIATRAAGETIEVAVGTGLNLPHLAREGDAVRLRGVDWSSAMLDRARSRALALGIDAELVVADAGTLPFEDRSADTVVCTFALCEVEDVRAGLVEMLRVLRPGGRLLLADHVVSTSLPLRLMQRAAELVSVPRHGEHFTRRPLTVLADLAVDLVEVERGRLGIIERVHARRRQDAA